MDKNTATQIKNVAAREAKNKNIFIRAFMTAIVAFIILFIMDAFGASGTLSKPKQKPKGSDETSITEYYHRNIPCAEVNNVIYSEIFI